MTLAPDNISRDQRSLLMYAETCAVDHGGLLEGSKMNAADLAALSTLADGGILTFGRIPGRLVGTFRRPITHWCDLTEAGWALAHQLRRARAAKVEPTRAAINAVRAARAADTEESQPQERTA